MTNDIQTALNAIVGAAPVLKSANGAGKAFELFVMTGIGRELIYQGYDVWLQRSDGTLILPTDANKQFVQRGGGPSGIKSAAAGTQNSSSIVFGNNNSPEWELLNGVQFEGRSSGKHEIDLAIIAKSVADNLRGKPTGGIPIGRPRVSIECKDVGTNGSVDEMRAFIARLYDLTLLSGHQKYLPLPLDDRNIYPDAPKNKFHKSTNTFWNENRKTLNIVARKTGFVSGAATLTGYHWVKPYAGIAVGSSLASQLFVDVAHWIKSAGF